jgi:hypothetical protein
MDSPASKRLLSLVAKGEDGESHLSRLLKYSPDQVRDERGRWSSSGIDGTSLSAQEVADHLATGHSVTVDPSQITDIAKHVASHADPQTRANPKYDRSNLANLHLSTGRDVFAQGPITGIYQRAAMPQIRADAKPAFFDALSRAGVSVTREQVSPFDLKPSQRDYSLAGASGMHEAFGAKGMFESDYKPKDGDRILVDKDGYVIDGHHRWAAYQMEALTNPDVKIPVIRIDASREELIGKGDGGSKDAAYIAKDGIVNKFVDSNGLARAKFGEVAPVEGKSTKALYTFGEVDFDPRDPKDKEFLDLLHELGNKSKGDGTPFVYGSDVDVPLNTQNDGDDDDD